MSLNWQFTDKARFDVLTPEEKAKNHAFIWGCMIVGIGQITEKTAEEWFVRYRFANATSGPFYLDGKTGNAWLPTLEDVRKRIGLVTNVTTETRAKWAKRTFDLFATDTLRVEKASAREAVRS